MHASKGAGGEGSGLQDRRAAADAGGLGKIEVILSSTKRKGVSRRKRRQLKDNKKASIMMLAFLLRSRLAKVFMVAGWPAAGGPACHHKNFSKPPQARALKKNRNLNSYYRYMR